jgi:hypothetical protein
MKRAQADLAAWVDVLSKAGVTRSDFRKDPKWRTLNAKCNQIQRRLTSLAAVEANDAACLQRKAENQAAAS